MKKTCCICGKVIIGGWGNSPWPVKDNGECCDKCNIEQVIPARIKMMKEVKEDTNEK